QLAEQDEGIGGFNGHGVSKTVARGISGSPGRHRTRAGDPSGYRFGDAVTVQPTDTLVLLRELEPVVERNLNRHLGTAKEWFPHEYVPWSEGRDFDGLLGGEAWDVGQSKLPEIARTSLVVNLLTEDNLPSYHHEIATLFGRDGAWGTWVHRWTAEEGRHGIAIRDYLLTTRA